MFELSRITSCNVCYTKLLRQNHVGLDRVGAVLAQEQHVDLGGGFLGAIIEAPIGDGSRRAGLGHVGSYNFV